MLEEETLIVIPVVAGCNTCCCRFGALQAVLGMACFCCLFHFVFFILPIVYSINNRLKMMHCWCDCSRLFTLLHFTSHCNLWGLFLLTFTTFFSYIMIILPARFYLFSLLKLLIPYPNCALFDHLSLFITMTIWTNIFILNTLPLTYIHTSSSQPIHRC